MSIPWDSLVIYTLGDEEVTDPRRRRAALDAFRRNCIVRDFHIRRAGAHPPPPIDRSLVSLGKKAQNGASAPASQAEDLSVLGPGSAAQIDWGGFAPELPSSIDLRMDAEAALGRGDAIRVERVERGAGFAVETLIVGERAGQAAGEDDAVWGDWDEASRTLRTADGTVLRLDGSAG